MKIFAWNAEKNKLLKKERGVSFEEVLFHLEAGDVLDVIDHPNQARYPGQMIYVIAIEEYVYLVPFVESVEEVFLKTIIPSRKATKQYSTEAVPMSTLDREEAEILKAYEAGAVKRAKNADELLRRHRDYAAAAFRKDARINIRLSSRDLRALQKRALAEGIPYQTLVSSVLHKYVEGRLHENG